jgi:hypothetical protein
MGRFCNKAAPEAAPDKAAPEPDRPAFTPEQSLPVSGT